MEEKNRKKDRKKGIEDVYRLYFNDLYHYLARLSRDYAAAQDLVQDTFIKAYEHLESYRGENVRPWLFRIAYHAFIDWYRREKRQVQTDPQVLAEVNQDTAPGPEEGYLKKERLDGWLQTLDVLPEKSRRVILLRDYHGFTYQEVAQVMGISLSSVKVTLFRARQKIRGVRDNEM